MLGFDRFAHMFADEFDLSPADIQRESRLVRDLSFDSLQLFRVALFLESLHDGIEAPEDVMFDKLTVGEVYSFYAAEVARHVVDNS